MKRQDVCAPTPLSHPFHPRSRVNRRLRRTLLTLALILLALYFAPQIAPVRNALLGVATNMLVHSGYDVRYSSSAGNLWRSLTLKGLQAKANGANASAKSLEVRYNLLALVSGKLPFSVAGSGLRGTIDVAALLPQGQASPPNEPDTTPGQARITPVLQGLSLQDTALTLRNVPTYNAPIEITRLEAAKAGESLEVEAGLKVGKAVADMSGTAILEPFMLKAQIFRADVALARPYYEGAQDGTVSGAVSVNGGKVEADLELEGGTVDVVGITMRDVSGPVTLRDQKFTTELTGRALGGSLHGSGSVDLRAQRWQGDVRGNAALKEAVVWLGQGRLQPQIVENTLGAEGGAEVALRLSGWQHITLAGSALGEGELLGESLRDLNVDFSFATHAGIRTTVTGQLGGKPLKFALEPKGKGFTMRADGTDLPLYGFASDLDLDLESQGGTLTGGTDLVLTRTALGRTLRLNVAATTDGEVWRAKLTGRDTRGARAAGEVTLRGSNLQGAVNTDGLELPGLATPLTVDATVNGPLSELPLTLELSGPRGVHPAAGGVRAEDDFSGTARATFTGGTLEDIQGTFGPLELRGALNDLRYTLAFTRLSDLAQGQIALQGGRLTREDGSLSTRGTLQTQDLKAASVTLPDLNAALTLKNSPLVVRLRDPQNGLDIALQDGLLEGELKGTRLGALGEMFGVTGTLSGRTANLTESLELDLSAATTGDGPGTTLRAIGTGERTRLTLRSEEGAMLAGRKLGGVLDLSGDASLGKRSAALTGTVGDLEVKLDAAPDATGQLRTEARLGSGPSAFSADFQTPETWRTRGTLPLSDLGTTFGLPLTGTLESNLAAQDGRYTGTATLTGNAFNLPVTLHAEGTDRTLELDVGTTVLDQPLALSGTLRQSADGPTLEGELSSSLASGPVKLGGAGLNTQLTLTPALVALPDASATLTLEATRDLAWTAQLTGGATLPYRNLRAKLDSTLTGQGTTYEGTGELTVAGEPIGLTLSGEGSGVQARATLDGVALAPFIPVTGTLSGDVRLMASGTTADRLRYFANLSAQGEAIGRPFDLALLADRASGLNLNGTLGETAVSVDGDLPLRRVAVTLANPTQPFDLTAFIDVGSRLQLQGAGAWRGNALSVSGAFTPRTGTGQLRFALDDAELEAKLLKRQSTRTVTATLNAPQGLLGLAQRVKAEARVGLGSSVTLERLNAAVGPNRLELSGTVRPETDLRGTLVVPTGNVAPADRPVNLTLRPLESSYLLSLIQGNLTLRGVLNPNFRPERVRLIGKQTRHLGGRMLELGSNLVWQEGQGFTGRSALELSGTPAATLTLSGDEVETGLAGLRVAGEGRYQGIRVASLDTLLSVEPWRDRTLTGSLEIAAPVGRLIPSWPGDPLALAGTLGLSGTLTDPKISGPLQLTGALEARGTLAATRQGGTLELAGPGLDLAASAHTAGYLATLKLGSLDLRGILPQLAPGVTQATAPPTLSLEARGAQTWGTNPDFQVTGLDFRSAHSTLSGQASYDGAVTTDLALDVDLADFSSALQGRIRGPLMLDAEQPFDETLELTGIKPAAADWALGGTVNLKGSISDPSFALKLLGSGTANGEIDAHLAPHSGVLDLSSTLQVAGLESDLSLTRTAGALSAAGTLTYREFGVTLSTTLSAGQKRLLLKGTERLAGWQASYGQAGLNLTGTLAGLNPQLRGTLSLVSSSTFQNIRGSLKNAAFGPVALGDVAIREPVADGGRALNLTGPALGANVGLNGALPWQVERLELALPGNVQVDATGSGSRTTGTLAATLKAASYRFPVAASYASGALALAAQGNVPLGKLELGVRYSGEAWQGSVRIMGDDTKPVLVSRLTGGLTTPQLEGTLSLERGANTFTGTFAAGRGALRLTSTVSSPQLTSPLQLEARGWPLRASLGSGSQTLDLRVQDGRLLPSGTLNLRAGPTALRLQGAGDNLALRVSLPVAPGLNLRTDLPTQLSAFSGLLEGLTLTGVGQTQGTLTLALRPNLSAQFDQLRWQSAAGRLTLNGTASLEDSLTADLSGTWRGSANAPLPWLAEATLPFTLRAQDQALTLSSEGQLGRVNAQVDLGEGSGTLASNLTFGRGRLESNLTYDPSVGPDGTLTLTTLPIFKTDDAPATLSTALSLTPSGVSGNGVLRFAGSSAELSGQAGWTRILPEALRRYTPQGGETLAAQVRLNRFELGDLPVLAQRAPYLSAPVSGVATLTGTQIIGQVISPELGVLETPLPVQLDFNGTFSRLDARATIGDSRLNLTYSREPGNSRLAGLLTLETFPLQVLAEAVTGASQVAASATGAARFDLPLANLRASYVRLATERLTLSGIGATSAAETTTEGNVALRFEDGSLFVERADFEGDGSWRAHGVLTPETLDFTFDANDADFSPLLRLVPQLATFGIGARGTLELRAAGSAAAPDITLTSPGLELSVAGGSYRVEPTTASLQGEAFTLESSVVGVTPIGGTLSLRGSGDIGLNPVTTRNLEFRFSGAATVPTIGRVTALRGRLYPSTSGWQLNGRGALGQPFTLTGPLAPLDLRLRGQGLNIRAPRYFLDSSSADTDVRVRSNAGNFDVSGSIVATTAQLSLAREQAAAQTTPTTTANGDASTTDEPNTSSQGSGVTDAAAGVDSGTDTLTNDTATLGAGANDTAVGDPASNSASTQELTTTAALASVLTWTTNPALERIRFADFRLRAPGQIFFESGFGNAELAANVVLTGTAAAPQLSGEARTLQGTVNFSGQEFTVQQAVATFDPTQGVFPTLDLDADVTFDKAQALGNLRDYTLVDPSGSTFVAQLAISGSFRRSASGRRTLDLEPTLSSDATLQEGSQNPRPLNETELLTLLTLGRLQLDAPIVGTNGLAETVATTALDTAVDLYLVSELQNALSDVLGVNLEIRTSSLSSVLGPDPQAFGVSVKLGGYLSDNLFASVQVGRFDDPDQAYALTNEFSLRYTANPLEINLTGGVNFANDSSNDGSPSTVTDFSLGFSYALTSSLSLDASLSTEDSGDDTNFGFGISYTW